MAQITPTTSSVSPTIGEDWINYPMNPQLVLRAVKATVRINDQDLTDYPAILFVASVDFDARTVPILGAPNIDHWIYASGDSATRDADFAVVDNAIGQVGGGGGSGEANTASNVGGGEGVFKQKVGVNLEFKSLVAGSNVSLVSGADTITINSANGTSTVFTNQNADYLAIAGNYVNMTTGATDKTVTLPAVPVKDDIIDVTKADSAIGRVRIDGNGFNINGETDALITRQYTSLTLQFDGTEWRIK